LRISLRASFDLWASLFEHDFFTPSRRVWGMGERSL
jgi:hypothetical protein